MTSEIEERRGCRRAAVVASIALVGLKIGVTGLRSVHRVKCRANMYVWNFFTPHTNANASLYI